MNKGVNDLVSLQGVFALASTTGYVNLPLALVMLSICGIIAAYVEECYKVTLKVDLGEMGIPESLVELEYNNTNVNVLTFILMCMVIYTNPQVPLVMSLVQSFIFGIYVSRYWLQYKNENYRALQMVQDRQMFVRLNKAIEDL